MALVITVVPEFKRDMMTQVINVNTDTFQTYLLNTTYPGFDSATQAYWADISAYELPTANGYTAGGLTLTGGVVSVDSQYAYRIFNTVQWQASVGTLGVGGAAVIDVTASNRIAAIIDNDNVVIPVGLFYTIANPTIRL